MTLSVNLPGDLVDLARQEAELHDRTVSNQITHWMSIGRVIERSGIYDYSRIASLLERQDRQDAA
jgi:hypothetical protein